MADWDAMTDDWNQEPEAATKHKDTTDHDLDGMDDVRYRQYCERTFQVIETVEQIGLPKPGQQLRMITFRPFNSAMLLAHICQKEKIKNLILVVYSINYYAARLINDYVKAGTIHNVTVLMSNLRNTAHRKKYIATKEMLMDNPRIKLMYAQSHAKLFSMETDQGNYYHIEGSGNMTFNSRIENYIIDNSREVYDYTVDWIEKLQVYLKGKKEFEQTWM